MPYVFFLSKVKITYCTVLLKMLYQNFFSGLAYKPLIVIAGSHVLKFFRDVDRSFENYTNDMHIVNISKLAWT